MGNAEERLGEEFRSWSPLMPCCRAFWECGRHYCPPTGNTVEVLTITKEGTKVEGLEIHSGFSLAI